MCPSEFRPGTHGRVGKRGDNSRLLGMRPEHKVEPGNKRYAVDLFIL